MQLNHPAVHSQQISPHTVPELAIDGTHDVYVLSGVKTRPIQAHGFSVWSNLLLQNLLELVFRKPLDKTWKNTFQRSP